MARRSARLARQDSSPASSQDQPPSQATPAKRKGESGAGPAAKRGKKDDEKEQTTLEDSMRNHGTTGETSNPQGMALANKEQTEQPPQDVSSAQSKDHDPERGPQKKNEEPEHTAPETDGKAQPTDAEMPDATTNETPDTKSEIQPVTQEENAPQPSERGETKTAAQEETASQSSYKDKAAVEPNGREEEAPSSMLEKGIIYFFFRGRVNVEDPQNVDDIARSYIIMRPMPLSAKIGAGPIGDEEHNCRLLALPKKVLPLSGQDRFLTFVEKTKTSFADIKTTLAASDYATKTAGTRHTPAMTPVAEGVYAITTTGRESHIVYIVNFPLELGELQKDIGIRQRGSFVTSAKNPESSASANANVSLPRGADYPKEILEEFHGRAWMPLHPKLLDYENTQFLLIGESKGIDNALRTQDEGEDQTPHEEMEKLEHEDEIRVRHLNEDDAIFADLGLSAKEFPKVQTTW